MISDDDRKLFRNTVGNVKEVFLDTVVHSKKKVPIHIHKPLKESTGFIDMMSDDDAWIEKEFGFLMYYQSNGISKRLFRKLTQGELFIDASIDLHGLTVVMAREELGGFLFDVLKNNLSCVKIIHGQGYNSLDGPIIRSFVNKWLRLNENVLAFTNAPKHLGGKGATLVLLRNQSF